MAAGNGLAAGEPPFILTLEMDGEAFARLNGLRQRYYPPERNAVSAHITLFHQLPGEQSRAIQSYLRGFAAGQPKIDVEVGGTKNLGGGVSISLRSPQLYAMRATLAGEWRPWLIPQDLGGYRPHVTIQNKVGAAEAKRTEQEVEKMLRPFRLRGIGLHLWRYRGGPWEDVQLFRFGS